MPQTWSEAKAANLAKGKAEGRRAERADVVAYLREHAPEMPPEFQTALEEIATDIERGDHLPQPGASDAQPSV